MRAQFRAYIDESGDEGFTGQGSEWLILSAVVTRMERDRELVRLLRFVRQDCDLDPKSAVHFRGLNHDRRVKYVTRVGKASLRVLSVIAHKPSVQRTTLSGRNRLYRYATRYLVERISWLCRDHTPAGGAYLAELVFSHRGVTPYDEMKAYLRRLLVDRRSSIHHAAISVNSIRIESGNAVAGLQVADAVAGSVAAAIEHREQRPLNDECIRLLRRVTYRRGLKHVPYGLKFLPPNVPGMIALDPRFRWLREAYRQ